MGYILSEGSAGDRGSYLGHPRTKNMLSSVPMKFLEMSRKSKVCISKAICRQALRQQKMFLKW